MRLGSSSPALRLLAACLTAFALAGCGAIKKTAINNVAGTLSSSGDVFTRDDDPELVRQALPFALKLYESLLESVPKNEDLLVATCSALHAVRLRVRRDRRGRARRGAPRRSESAARPRAEAVHARQGLLPARDGSALPRHHAEAARQPGDRAQEGREERRPAALLDRGVLGRGDLARSRQARSRRRSSRPCARWPNARSRSIERGTTARSTS